MSKSAPPKPAPSAKSAPSTKPALAASTATQAKPALSAKPRLGRGLSSLIKPPAAPQTSPLVERSIPVSPTAPADASASPPELAGNEAAAHTPAAVAPGTPVHELPVDQISPNPHQPRRHFDEAQLAELSASIKSNGLIQPVIVRKVAGGYELIAGERRLRASKLAGLTTIPAVVRGDVDGYTQAQLALVENIQRADLNPIDRALAYRTLLDQLGLTQAELAGRLGEDRSSIANHVRLLDLAVTVQELVRDGRLSLGHAKLLAGVPDATEQHRLANLVLTQSLSVRNLERLIAQSAAAKPAKAPAAGAAHLADLEKNLARQLGMRVQVKAGSKGKGRLIVHYANLDQFDDLLSKLGLQAE